MKLTKQAEKRMDGLVRDHDLTILHKSTTSIIRDMMDDGFELEDVKEYITMKMLRSFDVYKHGINSTYRVNLDILLDDSATLSDIPNPRGLDITESSKSSPNGYMVCQFIGKKEDLISWLGDYYGEDEDFFNIHAVDIS